MATNDKSARKVNVQARVNPDNLKKLDDLANERRWSRSEMIDWLIEQHVQQASKKGKER
jgi:metal-responsive CopG/Arc/MetJ family transcriptional regulator